MPDALEGGGGLERELGVLAASLRFEDLPGEVVQVFLNDTSSNCTPLGPIGSFTTQ